MARFVHNEDAVFASNFLCDLTFRLFLKQGTGMMQLTGLGDPSGLGEGYSFLREADTKPNKIGANSNGALNAQIKKITGTENDLRKLTMKQMASLLRSYGLAQKEIDKLKRWDRVHVIRDLSTKAASDGMGDGLERFARGEKMRLSDQKRVYEARIQEICRRQRAALSADTGDLRAAGVSGEGISSAVSEIDSTLESSEAPPAASRQDGTNETEDSDSDSDDDDFAAMLEENLKDVKQTNQLVAEQIRGTSGDEEASRSLLGQKLREGGKDLSRDARELAALKRQIEEERAANEGGIGGVETTMTGLVGPSSMIGKKVVRRRIIKKFPDGRQTTTFKFILAQTEVDRVLQHKKETAEQEGAKKKKYVYKPDSRPVGHAIFEDDDDVDHHRSGSGIRLQVQRRALPGTSGFMKAPSRSHKGAVKVGKLKQRVSHEKRLQKRKREEEEADLYVAPSKRLSTTSDRKYRASIRDRMPHVKLANKLESIRAMGERKPGTEPFHRPVNPKAIPRYYEVIHQPIDLQTIQNKNQR
jgi:transcription initiation factor TFIID subunit 1